MNTKLLEATKAVRVLLNEPEHWVRGSIAVDRKGHRVPSTEPDAYAFCLLGAFMRNGVILGHMNPIRHLLPDWAVSAPNIEHIVTGQKQFVIFNDDRRTSHRDVLEFLDRAVEYLERQKGAL